MSPPPMLETKEEAMERMNAARQLNKSASFQGRNQKPGRRDRMNTYTGDAGMSHGGPGNRTGLGIGPSRSEPPRAGPSLLPTPPPQSWSYSAPPAPPAPTSTGYTPGPYYPPPPPPHGATSYWNTQQYYPGHPSPSPSPAPAPPHAYANYGVPPPPQPQPATSQHHPIARPPLPPPPLYAYEPPYGQTPPLHHYLGQPSFPPVNKPPPRPLPQNLNPSPAESHSSRQKSSRPPSPKPKKEVRVLPLPTPSLPKSHFASLTGKTITYF